MRHGPRFNSHTLGVCDLYFVDLSVLTFPIVRGLSFSPEGPWTARHSPIGAVPHLFTLIVVFLCRS